MAIPVLPTLNGFSIHKRPTFETIVRSPPSGREVTRFQSPVPLWEFELTYEVLRDQTQNQVPAFLSGFTEFQQLSQVFVALGGQFSRFYYNDPTDNSRTGQTIGVGNGTQTSFRMLRTLFSGALAYTEPVGGVNKGQTINIYINGSLQSNTTYGFDSTNRFVIFTTAPTNGAVITADFSYYYYCRFIDDKLDFEQFDAAVRYELKSLRFRSINTDGRGSAISQNNLFGPIQSGGINSNPGPWDFNPFLYWEIQIVTSGTTFGIGGGGYSVCAGIASEQFQLINPWELNVAGTGPTVAHGLFWQFYFGGTGNSGWGWPFSPDRAPPCIASGDWMGFALDLTEQKLLIRNATQVPNTWYGQGYNGPFDISKGYDYSAGGSYPIAGPIYILGGAGWESPLPFPESVLNISGSFVAPVPTGYSPWGTGEWSPGTGLTVSGGNTLIANTGITGIRQPTAFTRTTSSMPNPE